MKQRRRVVVGVALAMLAAAGAGPAAASSVAGSTRNGIQDGSEGFSFAVIGDIPYGAAQIANFPAVISQINADPDVRLVDHLGDIKDGSSVCSDATFALVRSDFDTFADPLIYTPGDNEWTDCHRANNGSYNPLERLAAVRQTFFPRPGRTLGRQSVAVRSQASSGYPENVGYTRAGVAFAAVHIVGSNNSLAPWTGNTAPTPEQRAEVEDRTAAGIKLIHDTFAQARRDGDDAVVLLTQADMFDPTVPDPSFADYSAFQPIVRAIAAETVAFGGPVYLFNGDSHVYNADQPLAPGSRWLSFYGVPTAARNLSRVTVDGSTGVDDWLKVTINTHEPNVLSWVRVPFK